jgi:hypothetical protein
MAALGYAAAAVAVFVAAIVIEARVLLGRSAPMGHLLVIWVAIGAGLVGVVLGRDGVAALPVAIVGLTIYLLTTEVLLFVYAAALTSLSIRILIDAVDREPDPAGVAQALARHTPEAFLDLRLHSFLASGQMTLSAGRYGVTRRGRRWALIGRVLKRLLAVGHGG